MRYICGRIIFPAIGARFFLWALSSLSSYRRFVLCSSRTVSEFAVFYGWHFLHMQCRARALSALLCSCVILPARCAAYSVPEETGGDDDEGTASVVDFTKSYVIWSVKPNHQPKQEGVAHELSLGNTVRTRVDATLDVLDTATSLQQGSYVLGAACRAEVMYSRNDFFQSTAGAGGRGNQEFRMFWSVDGQWERDLAQNFNLRDNPSSEEWTQAMRALRTGSHYSKFRTSLVRSPAFELFTASDVAAAVDAGLQLVARTSFPIHGAVHEYSSHTVFVLEYPVHTINFNSEEFQVCSIRGASVQIFGG